MKQPNTWNEYTEQFFEQELGRLLQMYFYFMKVLI